MNRYLAYALSVLYFPLLLLFPLIVFQGKRVRKNTVRLAEPAGEREYEGRSGDYQLLHIGESTVAGIGVDHIQHGLSAAIYRHSTNLCSWKCIGHNGYRVADIFTETAQLSAPADQRPTVAVITFGVNDTTGFTALSQWQMNLKQLVNTLPDNSLILFTRVPAMQRFPALPTPLNWFLGLRAWQLDLVLRHTCREQGWHHIATPMNINPQLMASDGYHPNQQGYDLWGADIAATIDRILLTTGNAPQ